MQEVKKIMTRINQIKEHLVNLGEMRPGRIYKQYNVCGNPNCRCKDKDSPKKHGPYDSVSYTHKGRSRTEFVRGDELKEAKKQLKNYEKFKLLTQEWVDLSVEIVQIRKKANSALKKEITTTKRVDI